MLQYTYYTVTAFNIRVPMIIKRSLTTMQITQFLVGASCAMVHSFINYTIPVIAASQTDAPAASPSGADADAVVAATGNLLGSVKDTFARQTMPCITSTGQTFAVWLNVFYLAPLTYLFVSFFIESYLRRSSASQSGKRGAASGVAARRLSNNVQMAEKAGWEAAKSVEREVYGESSEAVIDEPKKANGRAVRSRN